MLHGAQAPRSRKRSREMTTEAPQGVEQNPAYRPQSHIFGRKKKTRRENSRRVLSGVSS